MRLSYNFIRGLLLLKMGAHLSSPKTEKVSTSGGNFKLDSTVFGATSMQGWRISMEDAHLTIPSYINNTDYLTTMVASTVTEINMNIDELPISIGSIYGVFDGHGGNCVSRWVSENFSNVFTKEFRDVRRRYLDGTLVPKHDSDSCIESKLVAEALQNSFLKVDQHLATPEVDTQLQLISNRKNDDLDSNNLFKVLLPDKLNNRQHAIDIIQQLTSFDTHSYDNKQNDELNKYDSIPYYKDEDVDEDIINNELGINTKNLDNFEGSIGGTASTVTVSSTTTTDTTVESGTIMEDTTTPSTTTTTTPNTVVGTTDKDMNNITINLLQKEKEDLYAMGCGATSVVVVVLEDPYPCVIVANAGDSRCVLSRNKLAVPLSIDHKPTDELELCRIRRAGGNVINGRVDGNLNLSRSLGDLSFKMDQSLDQREQKIISFPDVQIIKLTRDDEFLVLACDGIWDCKSNQQVVDFIHTKLQYYLKLYDKHDHTIKHFKRNDLNKHEKSASSGSGGDKGVGEKSTSGIGMVSDVSSSIEGLGTGKGAVGSVLSGVPSTVTEELEKNEIIDRMGSNEKKREILEKICEELCDLCLSNNPSESEGIGCDNMTVIIVLFNQQLYNKIH
ncbi:protein phosphatase 2c, putative [Theileria annulata]|uniref:protein-serine/threonine phosphatase n=1 Tax=Theileria annulata TaxID=5874 RepID=Q4UFJ8_THEAN|nr:protein phosphatase 2c, putative [Theileria annulata]CAI74118.1 protein phosphatase 2c, putative [Theileria annulata]|eukprot:XP_951850.1 protein phosphatase 2c, putative [Theileria annulata]